MKNKFAIFLRTLAIIILVGGIVFSIVIVFSLMNTYYETPYTITYLLGILFSCIIMFAILYGLAEIIDMNDLIYSALGKLLRSNKD